MFDIKFKNNILIFLIIWLFSQMLYAQEAQRDERYDLHPMHWTRFRARGLFDRNLIYCPVWNIGNFADSDLSPNHRLKWPGSEGLDYGEYFCFYIGALVKDMTAYRDKVIPDNWEGKDVPIVTDSYFEIYGPSVNSQLSKDRTHQCMWQARPGYFNDGVGGWVGGLNEDRNNSGELDPGEDINGDNILQISLLPPDVLIKTLAISSDKRTWPTYWPAGSFIGDTRPIGSRKSGLRDGLWNGEYGAKAIADQESYYVMDDHENDWWNDWKVEKYWPMKNADGTPNTTPWVTGGIGGAGVEIEGRGYAWFHPLAEDILVNLYRVRNYSDHVLNRVVTGVYADADIAGEGGENQVNYITASYEHGDRTEFDIMYQWHKFPDQLGRKIKVGVFGFAFLESPGISYNGKDDDADYMFDESMHNGIDDDHDWQPFSDIGMDRLAPGDPDYEGRDADGSEGNGKWDTEDVNHNGALDRGEDVNKNDRLDYEPENDDVGTDGVGPGDNEYRGPDVDGTECDGVMNLGEPNFDITDIDEADQAGLKHVFVYEKDNTLRSDKSFWEKYLSKEGTEVIDSDDDICFTFGARNVKLDTMKYERFCIAMIMGADNEDIVRNKSIMQRIYDSNYRFLTPPVQPTLVCMSGDRKIQLYWDTAAELSKDPFFGEDFNGYRLYRSTDPKFLDIKTITDAFGNVLLYEPLAIYDKIDLLKGPHPVPFPSLGVHYDMGNDAGLRHSYKDTLVENGRTYYYAVTAIDAGNDDDFFDRKLVTLKHPLKAMPSESPFIITVNRLGEVEFRDRNTAVAVPSQMAAGYTDPHVDTLQFRHPSGFAFGGRHNIEVFNRYHVCLNCEYELTFKDDDWLGKLDPTYKHGQITGIKLKNLTTDSVLFDLQDTTHYAFNNNIWPELEQSIYEGLHIDLRFPDGNSIQDDGNAGISVFKTDERGRTTRAWQQWLVNKSGNNLFVHTVQLRQEGYPLPFDFEIRVDKYGADTSWSQFPTRIPEYPLNFTTWNISDPANPIRMKVKYFNDKAIKVPEAQGYLWDSTRVIIIFGPYKTSSGGQNYQSSWEVRFFKNIADSLKPVISPQPGDIYRFRTVRPPDRNDVYRFTIQGGEWVATQAKDRMRDIYVVPDPYVASNPVESIYNIGGRSARRVDFVNLPPQCTIKIFTASGHLVKTIQHDSFEDFGRHVWDLTTDDGPEVAFGVYFYHVDAPKVGTKKGKLAIIK